MKRIVVLISGSGSNLEAIINSCNSDIIYGKVISVISNNPEAYGIIRAKKSDIDVKIINHKDFLNRIDFDNELEKNLEDLNPDLIVLAGFMRVLGKKITNKFNEKMINLHPSLLPLYPGLNTHEQVLKNKNTLHGISIHYVSPELDSGPLIAQGEINVKKEENINELSNRIHKIEHLLLPEIINEICIGNIYLDNGKVVFKYLDSLGPTFAPIYKKYHEI